MTSNASNAVDPISNDAGYDSSDSDSSHSDSSSKQIAPGTIRVDVTTQLHSRHAIIQATTFAGVCVLPTDDSPPGSQFTCAMASSNAVFSGHFDTQSEMVASLVKFIRDAMGPDTEVPIDQLLLQ